MHAGKQKSYLLHERFRRLADGLARRSRERLTAISPRRRARSGFVTKIALLGMVDNLGAGLVGPLISYWFFRRFGVELKSLGFMFFLSYFFAALSFLAAPVLARHMGVVKTMAF